MHLLRYLQTILLTVFYLLAMGTTYITVWLDRKFKFSLPFPRDLSELAERQKWCIGELKNAGTLPADAIINHYKVIPFKQEFIFRSNAGIIEINYSTVNQQSTLKCFAKFAPTMGTVWNKTIFNFQMNHIKEIFFNQYFVKEDVNIPAPRVYISRVSILTGHLCLVTELMEDCVEYTEGVYKEFPSEHLEMIMEGMATLHSSYWKCTDERMKRVMPIQESTVYFFDLLVSFSWSDTARKVLTQCWRRMNEFQTVLHGDARIGNMMFPKTETKGRFVFIDWQAVRKGKAIYDFAYFLLLSLEVSHRMKVEEDAKESYYKHLVAKGVKDYTREEMEEDYRHACLCVLLLLSLPMLSGEVSAEGKAAEYFVFGMGIWRDRLKAKFAEFDYLWMADRYKLTEQQSRDAVTEMLNVINQRLRHIEREAIAA